MPKSTGIPKSLLADVSKLKNRLASLEKGYNALTKDFKNTVKNHENWLKKQEQNISQLGKRSVKKEKRKPSEYNLFLKDKMSQGMTMIDAVKAWKARQGGMSSSMRQPSQEWQQSTQQY